MLSFPSRFAGFRAHRIAIALLCLALIAQSSFADYKSLAARLPAESNVIVAVDVTRLLNSPFGQQHQWADNMAQRWQERPLMVPPGVKQVVVGADLDTKSIDTTWQACIMEMAQMPSLDALVQAHKGYIDRVWDKNAVVSPQNAYFVPLDDHTLASLTPASRRGIAKWLREPVKPEGNLNSPYLKTVIMGLSPDNDVVMALDLDSVFAVPRARQWLEDSDIAELKGQDLDAIARLFGQAKGIGLNVKVDKDIMARATATFDGDTAPLANVAKPIMIGILKFAGMRLPDIDDWKFTTSGKTVSMEGKLSEESLRMLLSMVTTPVPTSGQGESMSNQQNASNAQADPAVASQRYYKLICSTLDGLNAKASLSETSTWFKNAAKRIETAPILNVDPALLDWGAMVTTKLKEVAAVAAVGYTQTGARSASLQSSAVDNGSYYYDANGMFKSKIGEEAEANRQQRRQASAEQKAQAQQQGLQILADIPASRAKIRQEMTQKYKMEF
jgi:hypothetical protein